MPRLTIDGVAVEVPEGATLLAAAEEAGIAIPTLCYAEGLPPQTTCMICVVEEKTSSRSLPACTAKAEDGMVVETNSPEIRSARKAVLELLLSEHAGDCEAPCRRLCPGSMNIPLMLRLIARGEDVAAARVAARDLVIPATLGWVCRAPCQVGCRRGVHDEAVAIRGLHRQVAEAALAAQGTVLSCAPDTGKHVAVVGSGPDGLASASVLRRYGHACTVYEKASQAGGFLRGLPDEELPKAVLDAELDVLRAMGIAFRLDCEVGASPSLAELLAGHDAAVVACKGLGALEGAFVTKKEKMPIRAVAAGKAAAEACHESLVPDDVRAKDYDARMDRVGTDEIGGYVHNRIAPAALARASAAENMREEAERCLHCDCHAALACKLRQYATEYGAEPRAFRDAERGPTDRLQRHGDVLFEVGKCVKCGLCIAVARREGEELGLSLAGRGFETRVAVPFGESLDAALKTSAQECVAVCPTGALALANQEEGEA